VNRCEMCIMGLKRSGNHAVINWIGRQFPGEKVYFLNNCRPRESPYETKHSEDSEETIIFNNYRIDRKTQRFEDKDCLLYSYENRSLKDVHNDEALDHHDTWMGETLKRYDVLLLRDPFNWIASSLRRDLNQGKSEDGLYERYLKLLSLWIEYAREFIGDTSYLKHHKTVINFNSWTDDRSYRQELAQKLGLNHTDAGLDEVVGVGGGSSFDGQCLDGAAQVMHVTNRWRHFESHPLYRKLLSDEIVVSLSRRIFGPVGWN